MNKDDFRIIALKIKGAYTYTCFICSMPGFIVQVNKIEDAPKELAKLLKRLLEYNIKHKNYDITEFKPRPKTKRQ